MAISGSIDLWTDIFPEDLLPGLFELIIESWKTFPQPSPDCLEVPITKNFVVHLRSNQNRSVHLFRIDWESNVLDEKSAQKGRIDIRFTHGYRPNEYFSFECKRLNEIDKKGRFFSLAGEYIDEGIMRYVNEQYYGGKNGGMIGYVMDGDIAKAVKSINDAIEKRRENLDIEGKAELKKSSIRPECQQTKETRHLIENEWFTVHHIFLPVTNRN
ncbi:MAG: hypothetical protein A2167_07485 [Planctomycetes bacterium RBG_13_46_10]|nr:MAG: hypothetical protein A2167_07485 [Planctomycetes bacterium RBG_13_46_10]